MGWVVKTPNQNTAGKKWVVKQPANNQPQKQWVVKQPGVNNAPKPEMPKSAWNKITENLIKPLSSASNLLEDSSKVAGFGLAKMMGYQGNFQDAAKQGNIDFLGHQKDVWTGQNNRTYSDIMNEMAQNKSGIEKYGLKAIGYGGDFALDPLNKVKILSLTGKGNEALKVGKLGLSAAEQAGKGERALLQLGKYNVTPNIVNKAVLGGTTKLNDLLRATNTGGKVMTGLSKVSGKIRPGGVNREEFKLLTDAKTAARNTAQYTQDKAIEFAKGLQKTLTSRKATDFERSQLLHAIEKGEEKLAPTAFQDLWKVGVDFKNTNTEMWQKLGGSVLEGHGLSHVATKEVAEQARKDAFKGQGGFKLTSTNTPQDIHRQWVKVGKPQGITPLQEGGKIVNLADEGIKYIPDALEKGKGAYIDKSGKMVKVSQASAQEINNALVGGGKKEIFQEDLPIVAAKMGISTGRKKAGVEFLEATKNLKSEEAKKLAEEVHNKMVNPESLKKALQMFDGIQNIWKAQALVAPSYHIRNMAGNLWNNYLADVKTGAYAIAGKLQNGMRTGKLTEAEKKLVSEMEKHGVIGTGQYGGDIEKLVSSEIGKTSINPFSQRFAGYKANRAVGSAVEDNAKIAHFISKIREGYGAKQAAESVKKYLFDYGDLTDIEKGVLKRIMPFYTWTSKNIPLQIQQFIEKPGKYSKIATVKKDIEQGVPQPNEKFISQYIAENGPIRMKQDDKGNTQYFLLGQWLPAAAALNFLSRPIDNIVGMVTPGAKLPYETLTNTSTFFQDTLGENAKLKSYPGDKDSWLGVDLDPRLANALRSLRLANEADKLNPGEVFGGRKKASIWKGTFDNASSQKYGKYTPETTQMDRILNLFTGKMSSYNPKDAKTFYDRDTQNKITEYESAIKRAKKNSQIELAQKLIKERTDFLKSRSGGNNLYNQIKEKAKSTNPFYEP